MDRKLQVFVSSTFDDLRVERQAAVSMILEMGHIPAGMELFAAGDQEQVDVIQRWIDESDVFVLILGSRYGSIEPRSGKSYTHLEYEYARSKEKPYFAVIMNETGRSGDDTDGAHMAGASRSTDRSLFDAFKVEVRSNLCELADDEKDVKVAIAKGLSDQERRARDRTWGWIPARVFGEVEQRLAQAERELEEARSALSDSRRILETSHVVRNEMEDARVLRMFGRYEPAIERITRALEADRNSEEAWIELAVLKSFEDPGRIVEAISILESVVHKYPESGRAYYNLACLHHLRREEYLGFLRKAVDIRPRFSEWAKHDPDFEDVRNSQEFKDSIALRVPPVEEVQS